MTTLDIKTAIMAWFRFGKSWPYVATEAGGFSADVIATNGNTLLYEVEVKVSIADFRADFTGGHTKKRKHAIYSGDEGLHYFGVKLELPRYEQCWIPNMMYYAVPQELKEQALKVLEKKNPKYGLIAVRPFNSTKFISPDVAYVVKRAKKIHTRPVEKQVMHSLAARASSAYVNMCLDARVTDTIAKHLMDRAKEIVEQKDIEQTRKVKLT